MLHISDLNVYYGESHILRDVDLNINAGEMVCLIGRNGVGKTTLLKTLMGILKPRAGAINYEQQNLINKTSDQSHSMVSSTTLGMRCEILQSST